MFYPWNLSDNSGSLALLLSYSRALKSAGYRLDCYAPKGAVCDGVFDNVFVSPDRDSPLLPQLESAGAGFDDPLLHDKLGRDDAAMAAAGVLASIADYDVVGVHYTRCHSLKQMLPSNTPAVMFTHDVDSLVGRQEEKIFGALANYKLADEVARLKPFNLVTVVGPEDKRVLQSVEPALPIVEAPFTLPLEEGASIRDCSPGVLLWISSAAPAHRFSFFWFWNKVWPKIRSERPECRLVIAGRMSELARQFGAAADSRVSVLGVVEDADRLYRDADILIAPYYFGLGIKTKVIEALAKGISVATTTLGIYNTRIQPGCEAVVSDDASGYASQVIKLISSPQLRSDLALKGREYVRTWHDPGKALAPLVEAFERVRREKKKSPKSRAGALLNLYEPLSQLVPKVIERCRNDKIKTVAIYGAGSHTRLLVPIWQALEGPAIRTIIETGEPSEADCMGFPVLKAQYFDPARVDAVVLSSYGYEEDMAAVCNERWPGLKVVRIWRPVVTGEDFETMCHEKIPNSLYEFI
jgi:hypothetical protein